jgi:predicted nucleotidyltransferase
MIELLDYILDYDDNFWIVNNISGVPKGYIVYRRNNKGTRYNFITKKYYIKDNDNEGIIPIPINYKQIFKPKEFYLKNKCNLFGIWKRFVEVLNNIGIDDQNIGIFGSYLIGFPIEKDVDFVIYRLENLYLYYKNNEKIKKELSADFISNEHIEYQYNKHKVKFPSECDLKEIISRNWSGLQIKKGVLSTPRFIDSAKTVIPDKQGEDKVIQVEVCEGFTTAFLPRVAKVIYKREIYNMVSSLWKFQSFARNGDIMNVYGNIDEDNKVIILDDNKYYINYIKKANTIL